MSEEVLIEIASLIVLGIGAQWLASRLRMPSILLLLLFGFLAGPVVGVIHPDERFGSLLFPFVSLSVALILYEGGLTLRLAELRGTQKALLLLVSLGALITWAITAVAATVVFDLSWRVATLLGAILVVTGPTVIGPLLRHIRPTGPVGSILKWEGIVIDPIGAVLAVLVFEAVGARGADAATAHVVMAIVKTIVAGGGLGVAAAYVLALLIRRFWVPDFLQNAVSLMFVVAVFTAANIAQHEAGLVAVTVMGFVLANQRMADVRHIVEFKENLRVLLISALFILLAARLEIADLADVGWQGLIFLAVLICVARPLSVFASTMGSDLRLQDRAFLSWVAPRGIVAAAVSSIFALRMEENGIGGAELMVPITFLTIIGTVAIYGLTAPGVARKLGVAAANPQGVLFVGAQAWTRAIARLLADRGFPVLLVDNNHYQINQARMEGLPTYSGSILAEYAVDEINLGGLGRLLAVTPNDWINALAAQRFTRIFGREQCYQIVARDEPRTKAEGHKHLHGRWLFSREATYAELSRRYASGYVAKATRLSEAFDYAALQNYYGEQVIPMFVITETNRLHVLTVDGEFEPLPGHTVVSLVKEGSETEAASETPTESPASSA